MEPERIGPYALMHRLGAGGMAETFAAVRRGPGRFEQWVCIKRILPGQDDDPAQVELFLDEARLLAQLRNANIVQVYDFGEANGSYYMALELVEGLDLSALLRAMAKQGARLPYPLAMYVLTELLRALDYAHTVVLDNAPLGVVHRDVSPSNLLVARHGEVKLTDFGIATYSGRTHKTRTGYVRGKVAYMSPEQLRAEPLDVRTDLFAAGIVGFEMLAGVHPFDGPSDIALLQNIHTGKRPRIEELMPELPASVVALIDGLLEIDRDKRITSAADALARVAPAAAAFSVQKDLALLVSRFAPARTLRTSEPSYLPSDPAAVARAATQLASDGELAPDAARAGQTDGVPSSMAVRTGLTRPRGGRRWLYAAAGVAVLGAAAWLGTTREQDPPSHTADSRPAVVPAPPVLAEPPTAPAPTHQNDGPVIANPAAAAEEVMGTGGADVAAQATPGETPPATAAPEPSEQGKRIGAKRVRPAERATTAGEVPPRSERRAATGTSVTGRAKARLDPKDF